MIKLSKTTLIFLAVGIFVVLAASLLMAYSQRDQERSQLSEELSSAQASLAKQWAKFSSSSQEFSYQQGELERQLDTNESQIDTAKTNLRQSIESVEVTDTCFEVARTNNVKIVKISSLDLVTGEELEGIGFFVLPLEVQVRGDLPNLIDFIFELTQQFPTSLLESTEISVTDSLATVTLDIHHYGGD